MTYSDFKNAVISGEYKGTAQSMEYIAEMREEWMRAEVMRKYAQTETQGKKTM